MPCLLSMLLSHEIISMTQSQKPLTVVELSDKCTDAPDVHSTPALEPPEYITDPPSGSAESQAQSDNAATFSCSGLVCANDV